MNPLLVASRPSHKLRHCQLLIAKNLNYGGELFPSEYPGSIKSLRCTIHSSSLGTYILLTAQILSTVIYLFMKYPHILYKITTIDRDFTVWLISKC